MAQEKADFNPIWVSDAVKRVIADYKELTSSGFDSEKSLRILELAYANENHGALCNYMPEVFWHEFCGAMRSLFGDSPSFRVGREE